MKKLVLVLAVFAGISLVAYGLSFAGISADSLEVPGAGKIDGWKAFHMKHGSQKAFKDKIENYKAPGCVNSHCHSKMPANMDSAPKDIKATCTDAKCHDLATVKDHIEKLKK